MTPQAASQPSWWIGLNIALILCSAVIVLFPPMSHVHAFTLPFLLLLCPAYLVAHIRRMKADGTGNMPIGELYRQVKAGRRLPRNTLLETAAMIAFVLATMHLG
jgi:hypothetical protein